MKPPLAGARVKGLHCCYGYSNNGVTNTLVYYYSVLMTNVSLKVILEKSKVMYVVKRCMPNKADVEYLLNICDLSSIGFTWSKFEFIKFF